MFAEGMPQAGYVVGCVYQLVVEEQLRLIFRYGKWLDIHVFCLKFWCLS